MSKIKTLLAIGIIIWLTGCGHSQERVRIVEKEVPVIIPCLTSYPERPEFPLQNASSKEDHFSLTKKALAEIEIRKGYENQLESAIVACKK